MSHVEKFANENTDGTLSPLRANTVGPVLATPALGAGILAVAAAVTKEATCAGGHHGRGVTPAGPVPSYGSVNELLSVRVASIN